MDIATLGIAVDSSQADKGAVSLTKLSAAAKQAEAATKGTAAGARSASAASAAVSGTANSAAAALNTEAAAATKAASAMRMHATAVNDNVQRMGGSFSGLAAQVQDIGVTAAMGMNPLIIGLQQGTQIAGQMEVALQNGGSAASVFSQAIMSLLSPVSLLSIALTVLLAAGLQMVDWPAAAAWAMNGLADLLQTIAPYAAAAAAGLALLYAPAIVGGLVQLIALMSRVAVSAVAAAAAMAAANPAAAFVIGITAAVAAANIFRDELARIFGIDIVGAAKDAVNNVIAYFHGGYEGIVAAWGALPGALGDIAIQAANRVLDAIQQMVRSAVTMINSVIASTNGKLRELGIGFQLPSIDNKIPRPQIENPFEGAAAGVGASISDAIAARLGTDYLGNFGTAIANGASGAAEKLRELAGSFGTVEEAAGKAGGAAEGAAKKAKDPWEGLRETTNQVASAFQDAGRSTGGILKGLVDGTLTWREALSQALSVALKLMQSLNPNFLGGGFFQGLLGGLLGFANGGAIQNGRVIPFAKGGIVTRPTLFPMANGAGLMGEAGPEAIMPLRRGRDGKLGVAGGGNTSIVIEGSQIVIQGDANRQTQQDLKRYLDERDRKLMRMIPQMVDKRTDDRQVRRVRP
mgnify:CR=1 FL=1